MASPFPGMDPYLETPSLWSDFGASFITYWRDALMDCLPENYEARIDEKVSLVEVSPPRKKLIEPDVAITQRAPSRIQGQAPAGLATLEPVTLSLVIEEETHERHIEILHRPDRTLVAALELLSPANKEEPGRTLYLAKRNASSSTIPSMWWNWICSSRGSVCRSNKSCLPEITIPSCRVGTSVQSARSTTGQCANRYRPSPSPCLRPTLMSGSTWALSSGLPTNEADMVVRSITPSRLRSLWTRLDRSG